ncbi:DUF2787 family protein [Photobacterium sp. R1]
MFQTQTPPQQLLLATNLWPSLQSSYSAGDIGFHSVEIGIDKTDDGTWNIEYITDFAYVGNNYPLSWSAVSISIFACSRCLPSMMAGNPLKQYCYG